MYRALGSCCLLAPLFLSACSSSARAPVTTRGDAPRDTPAVTESRPTASAADAASATMHEVIKGDTLYSIAWRYGQDYRDIARWNGIGDPYLIVPGRQLRVIAPANVSVPPAPPRPAAASGVPDAPAVAPPRPALTSRPGARTPISSHGAISWQWPTSGRVIKSDSPTARKGLEISGSQGQSVIAAAAGSVVYSGSGLLGYGRLIILKHSETFLSAYAYNERLLVAEGDQVVTGQQIATMGLDNSGQPVLHFEIRKDGRPVNPMEHLPRSPQSGRS
ncbi:MAG: hypothetical protein A3H91_04525 [Gammaproteobacteria bacterium RIFCSPLOWO2_02_FULL_61_13]|nr:MAG: hypothetical protein A3H91_04525 [Gammaproteobacteria bacterium RIFCSPLOWO2_02_FULL_61_13]